METTTKTKKTEAVESIGPHGTRGGTCAAPLVLLLACSCCAITLTLTASAAMKLHCFTGFVMESGRCRYTFGCVAAWWV